MNPGSTRDRTEIFTAARADLATFVEIMFPLVTGQGDLAPNWHIEATCYALERVAEGSTRRLILNLPPRHLKSFCASVAFPLWLLGRNPAIKIICISYGDSLVEEFARQRLQLANDPVFREIFPNCHLAAKQQNLEQLGTTRGGRIVGLSMGGPITGKGCDVMIIDDPMKADESQSETARERVAETFRTTLFSRFNNRKKGAIVLAMQRLHIEDLTAKVQQFGGWDVLSVPAQAPADATYQLKNRVYRRRKGALIQKARYGLAQLAEDRKVLGHYAFEAQYQQNPLPVEGNLVQAKWFKRYTERPDQIARSSTVISVDPASSADRDADYSVLTVWGIAGHDYYLLDLVRGQFEFPVLKRKIAGLAQRWAADRVLIEQAGVGIALYQQFRQENPFPVTGIKPKGDKQLRLAAVSPIIEDGRVHIPREGPWHADFLREMLSFPKAARDDQVDSLSQFLNWVKTRPRLPQVRIRTLSTSSTVLDPAGDGIASGRGRAYARARSENRHDANDDALYADFRRSWS